MPKPILLKDKHQIYTGLTEAFYPGCLVHVKLTDNKNIRSPHGKYKSWFIGAGISCLPYSHQRKMVSNHWFPIKPTHIVYVLYCAEFVALFYALDHNKKTGLFLRAFTQKNVMESNGSFVTGWEYLVRATSKNKKFKIPEPVPGFLMGLESE